MRTSIILIVLALVGSANATWTNPVGGSGVTVTADSIWWGTGGPSGLTFTQNPLEVGVFELGTLTHTNRPIAIGSNVTAVDLLLQLPGGDWVCPMTIDETINLGSYTDDQIAWDVPAWYYGGLTILGFGSSPADLVDCIWTPECRGQDIALWASYYPPAVPVPGSLLLASVGCAVIRWRRTRKY